jgi:hypothetical protein
VKQKVHGVVVDEFSLSGSKGSWCQGSFSAIGSGKVDRTSTQTIPTETIATPIRFTDCQAATGAASGARDLASRLRSFNFAWGNGHLADDWYLANATAWNSGPIKSRCEFGLRSGGTMEVVLDAQRAGDDEFDELLAATEWAFTLTLRGKLIGGAVYEEVKIVIPKCKVDAMPEGWDGQIGTRTVQLTPIYDSDLAAPLKIEIVDAISTRLSAAS